MRRRYKLLLALLVLVGVPYYWLLVDNSPGNAKPATIDIAEARRLAATTPGPLPEVVRVQQVGWRRVPGALFVAGGGLKRNLLSIYALQLDGPWGSIVIDSGMGAAEAEELGLEHFSRAEQAKVDAALRSARLIVLTHEHGDHAAGLLRLPDFAMVASKALIPPEQGPGGAKARGLPWPTDARAAIPPFAYTGMKAIAPGVVLIRAPGHTPGSQMIFARLANGREYLFTGDTATMARSWEQLRARSRLIGDYIVGEDRDAVFGWLKAIRAAQTSNPKLVVVPGHDYEELLYSKRHQTILKGFASRNSPKNGPRIRVVSGKALR